MFWCPKSAKRGVSWGTGVDNDGDDTAAYRREPGFAGAGEPIRACPPRVEYGLFLAVEGVGLMCCRGCILICCKNLSMER